MGDVFQRNCMILMAIATRMLHSVTRQRLIACLLAMNLGQTIVQTRQAVKPLIKTKLFSVIIVKPAYQKVSSFHILLRTYLPRTFFDTLNNSRKNM